MQFFNNNKMAIGGGLVLIIAVAVYFMYFSGSSGSAALVSSDNGNPADTQDLLVTLQNLHTIKLDDSIFTNPIFVSLTDFGVTLPSEDSGRRDPFLPIIISGSAQGSVKLPAVK